MSKMDGSPMIGLDDKHERILKCCKLFLEANDEFELMRKELSIIPTFLFWGLPGTGKTTFAHEIYKELKKTYNIDLYLLNMESLLSYNFGESSKNLVEFFEKIENDISKNNSLAFVLIDEVDFFTLNRHQENADAIKRVLLTFNKIVDKLLFDNFINKIIIVGTTNLRDSLDVSVLRRFYFHENFNICLKQENLIELIERLSKIVPKYRKTDVEELFEICSEKKYTLGEIKNILAENYLKSKISNTSIMNIETFKKRESLYDILNKQKGIIKNGR